MSENNEMKIEVTGDWKVEDGELYSPEYKCFGRPTDEQRAKKWSRFIPHFFSTNCPEEIQAFLREWNEKIRSGKYRWDFGIIAEIEFGYGERIYTIKDSTFGCGGVALEEAADDILRDLMAIGCNYGRFYSRLD